MKAALLYLLLLSGCASKCADCLTLTPAQLGAAMQKAWVHGWSKGWDDNEDATDLKRLKPL